MKPETPFAVLSPDDSTDKTGPHYAAVRAGLRRAGLDFSPVYGIWEGKPEHSFLVLLPDGDAGDGFATVMDLASRAGQDAVLYVGADREAAVIGRDGTSRHIGHWQAIPPVGPRPESYTVGPDGRVYCVL